MKSRGGLSGVWNLPVITHHMQDPDLVCIDMQDPDRVCISLCLTDTAAQSPKFSSAPVNRR